MKIPDKFWNVLQGTAKGTGSAGSKISVATSKGIVGGCYCGGQIVAGQKVFLAKAQNNQWWVFSSVPNTTQVVRNTKQIFKGKAPVTKIIEQLTIKLFKTVIATNLKDIIKAGDSAETLLDIDLSLDDGYPSLYIVNANNKNTNEYTLYLVNTTDFPGTRHLLIRNQSLIFNYITSSEFHNFFGYNLHGSESLVVDGLPTPSQDITFLIGVSGFFPYNVSQDFVTVVESNKIRSVCTPFGIISKTDGTDINSSFSYYANGLNGEIFNISATVNSGTISGDVTTENQPAYASYYRTFLNTNVVNTEEFLIPLYFLNGDFNITCSGRNVTCVGSATGILDDTIDYYPEYLLNTNLLARINNCHIITLEFDISATAQSEYPYTSTTASGDGSVSVLIQGKEQARLQEESFIVYESTDGLDAIYYKQTLNYDYYLTIDSQQSGITRNTTTELIVTANATDFFYLNETVLNTENTLYQTATIQYDSLLLDTLEENETFVARFDLYSDDRMSFNRCGNHSFNCSKIIEEISVPTPTISNVFSFRNMTSLFGGDYSYQYPFVDLVGQSIIYGKNGKTYKGYISDLGVEIDNAVLTIGDKSSINASYVYSRQLRVPFTRGISYIEITFEQILNTRLAREDVLINPNNATAIICSIEFPVFDSGINFYKKDNDYFITDTPIPLASEVTTASTWYTDVYKYDAVNSCFKYFQTTSSKITPNTLYSPMYNSSVTISSYV